MAPLFTSFFQGGFECSTHRRRDGRRLDIIAATGHDSHAAADYRLLQRHGIHTVRDGLRWHLIEAERGRYDWSHFRPMLDAARTTGTQVIWDLLHYGWPDWTNPWDAEFPARFAAFAAAAAARIGPGGFYTPVNEISYLAWGGGEVGRLNPFQYGRGDSLKRALCRAAIAAIRAIRSLDSAARMVTAEPLIHANPAGRSKSDRAEADDLNNAQFHAVDCLLGRRDPELGGEEGAVDIVGFNYYPHNQWIVGNDSVPQSDPRHIPLARLLVDAWRRYGKPVMLAETGCEGDRRADWLAYVTDQSMVAMAAGADIVGICLYPIFNHHGWDDDRYCPNGMFCGVSGPEARRLHAPLAKELARQIAALPSSGGERRRSATMSAGYALESQ